MKKSVGIRFKPAGKIYDFDSGAFVLRLGDEVIVETENGLSFGMVATLPVEIDEEKTGKPLKKVYRKANEKDLIQLEKNREKEIEAQAFCQQCIDKLGLQMNLFSVESTFDARKLTFFFTADGRVDFRQLVKMLVKEMGVRIEMRQVGIRNQAKMCGGLGRCGRVLCCASYMESFGPVSIRMAKEQGLSLNPTKISGQCGRLMCCLTFEFETYQKMKKGFPKLGKNVETKKGRGKVIRHNALNGSFTVRMEDGGELDMNPADVTRIGPGKPKKRAATAKPKPKPKPTKNRTSRPKKRAPKRAPQGNRRSKTRKKGQAS